MKILQRYFKNRQALISYVKLLAPWAIGIESEQDNRYTFTMEL